MSDPAVFEQAHLPRNYRLHDAAIMLERLAAFFAEDGFTRDDFLARCQAAWEATDDD